MSANSKLRPKASIGGILLPPPPSASKAAIAPDVTIPSTDTKSSPTGSTGSSSTSFDLTTTSNEKNSSNSFHQQLLDGLESLSVTDAKDDLPKTTVPILTPANSFSVSDDFALFAGPANANVISANGSSKKTDEDLWSDFESFRNTTASASKPMTGGSIDDWAKF